MIATMPSSAAIVYAAADLFVAPAHRFGSCVVVPCTGNKVDEWDLGVNLLAACLADMVQQELVTLRLVESTKLFVIHTTHVALHIAPGTASRLAQTGLAAWLVKGIVAQDGGKVYEIVRAAYGRDVLDPVSVVTGLAVQELVALDFYEDTVHEVGGIIGGLQKAVHAAPAIQHIPVPRCERFSTLREPATHVLQMLQTIGSRNNHLWETLLKELRHAIASRVETPPTSPNIG